jgi:hypothetical protein
MCQHFCTGPVSAVWKYQSTLVTWAYAASNSMARHIRSSRITDCYQNAVGLRKMKLDRGSQPAMLTFLFVLLQGVALILAVLQMARLPNIKVRYCDFQLL